MGDDDVPTSTGPGGSMEDVPDGQEEPTTYIVGRTDLEAATKEITAHEYEEEGPDLVFYLNDQEVARFKDHDRLYVAVQEGQ